jgi:hypothetical protein
VNQCSGSWLVERTIVVTPRLNVVVVVVAAAAVVVAAAVIVVVLLANVNKPCK